MHWITRKEMSNLKRVVPDPPFVKETSCPRYYIDAYANQVWDESVEAIEVGDWAIDKNDVPLGRVIKILDHSDAVRFFWVRMEPL